MKIEQVSLYFSASLPPPYVLDARARVPDPSGG